MFSYLTANFGIASINVLSENYIYKFLNNHLKENKKIKFEILKEMKLYIEVIAKVIYQ